MSGYRHQVKFQGSSYVYEIFAPGKMLPERPASGPYKTHAQATAAALKEFSVGTNEALHDEKGRGKLRPFSCMKTLVLVDCSGGNIMNQMLKYVALFGSLLIAAQAIALADPISADRIAVIDGDTIRLDNQKPDVRLVGFNTPETKGAKNDVEFEIGTLATERLRELIKAGELDFSFVDCACKKGTAGTRFCNHGRSCGVLKAKGIDVGKTLVDEMLAVEFKCGPDSCPKTPTPWR